MASTASGIPARALVPVTVVVSPGGAYKVLTTLLDGQAALNTSQLTAVREGEVHGVRCIVHDVRCMVHGV